MDEFTGTLRETVAIERWVPTADDSGTPGSWAADGTAWAALEPVDPTQLADVGERRIGRPRYRLTLRAPTVATLTSRFLWRGRILVIVRAEPDPRSRDRTIFLVEDRT